MNIFDESEPVARWGFRRSLAVGLCLLSISFGVVSLSVGATQAQTTYVPISTTLPSTTTVAPASTTTVAPASEEILIPDTSTVTPGGRVVFDANGFKPGSTVMFTVKGSNIGTAVANSLGVATFSWKVPASQGSGRVTASAIGVDPNGQPAVATATVTVKSRTGLLPGTGSDSFGLIQVAMVLLAVGAIGVVVGRRRSKSDSDDSGRGRSDSERLTV